MKRHHPETFVPNLLDAMYPNETYFADFGHYIKHKIFVGQGSNSLKALVRSTFNE